MSTDIPADPKAVKKMEKAIAKEAQVDEKDYKRVLKELKRSEKSQAKALKSASNADRHLRKMEGKERDTVRSLQKATRTHDQAVTNLHTAQSDVQSRNRQAQNLERGTDDLRARVDEFFKAKQLREEERSRKLASLRAPDVGTSTVAL